MRAAPRTSLPASSTGIDLACTAVIVVIPISSSARVVGAERPSVENGTRAEALEVDSDAACSGAAFDFELDFLGSAAGSTAAGAAEAEVEAEAEAEAVGSFPDSSWSFSFCLLFFLFNLELLELELDFSGDILASFQRSIDER